MPSPRQLEAAKSARIVHQRNAAERALDDPHKVARAIRITRAAVDNGFLTVADIFAVDEQRLVDLAKRMVVAR